MALHKVEFSYSTTMWDELDMDLDPSLDKYTREDAIYDQLRMAYPEGEDFKIEQVNAIA